MQPAGRNCNAAAATSEAAMRRSSAATPAGKPAVTPNRSVIPHCRLHTVSTQPATWANKPPTVRRKPAMASGNAATRSCLTATTPRQTVVRRLMPAIQPGQPFVKPLQTAARPNLITEQLNNLLGEISKPQRAPNKELRTKN